MSNDKLIEEARKILDEGLFGYKSGKVYKPDVLGNKSSGRNRKKGFVRIEYDGSNDREFEKMKKDAEKKLSKKGLKDIKFEPDKDEKGVFWAIGTP